ncbi:uncharacterized protein LOC129727782 isoform X2 [Wyeomyia smithii]|nr:uncharacterized protein LOC129727782 isoform X2 [Wyeomyia smithii]
MKKVGKIEKTFKYLLPAVEQDLGIKVPLNIKPSTLDRAYTLLIDKVYEYFKTDGVMSRYQLLQHLKSFRDEITEIVNEKISKGTLVGSILWRTIQPFLQYESHGSLDLPIDHEQMELLYFECETNQLKVYSRPKNNNLRVTNDNSDFKQLFFMPGIRVTLNLPFLEMVRQVISNCERYVVTPKGAVLKNAALKPNGRETFQKVDNPYRLKSSKVGQNITLEYLDILINLFEAHEFMMNQNQRSTLIFLLQQIRSELSDYEMKELHVTYGCYLSKYKYYRLINNDIKPDSRDGEEYLYVKEVINPELNFQFLKAIDIDMKDFNEIEEYFAPILGYVDKKPKYSKENQYLEFADQLKKAIMFSCDECNTSFDSSLARITIQEHKFCGLKKWKCTNCQLEFQENEIASRKWTHNCIESAQ